MHNCIIESIGVYIPEQSFSTTDVIDGCKNKIRFPLEKITGIKSRPIAGKDEFSIDLAKKAIANCLQNSRYHSQDIDLLICCNISRYDGSGIVSFEPSTSIKLKKHFDFSNALAFDIANACAGMFTGIYIVDSLIKSGAIRKGMVVSGEYITHLTKTAQEEIENFMDSRLACLTLGDAGAALILEGGSDDKTGFQEIDIVTLGAYSKYCIAKTSSIPQGGFIMYTDSINLTDKGIKYGARHAIDTLQRAKWAPKDFQHLVMHQTSAMTLNSARREINHQLNSSVCNNENTINNLEYRGNSASTAHFVAIADNIRNKRINCGDKIVFGISASGLTVGTALYTFDALPDRLRANGQQKPSLPAAHQNITRTSQAKPCKRIQIVAIGTTPQTPSGERDSLQYASFAANNCIENSSYQRRDIDVLIYCGVYRSEYIVEPAYASLLAGELDINSTTLNSGNKTLAFDVFNGGVGFLNACYIAQQMIEAEKCKIVMIVAAEIENNAESFPDKLVGLRETGSALLLDSDSTGGKGFSSFLFTDDTSALDAYSTYWTTRDEKPFLHIEKDENLELMYISCIIPAINQLLRIEELDKDKIAKFFPPQISSEFIARLSGALNLPLDRFINIVGDTGDYLSSSTVYAMKYARDKKLVKSGDIGLVITVGSGIQVGCALYHF